MCIIFSHLLRHLSDCSVRYPGASTDSHFAHLAWATAPRKQGGLGPDLQLPLIADKSMSIARDYNVLIEEEGIALRGLFIIDPKGTLRYVSSGCTPERVI